MITQTEMALDILKRYEWVSCLDFMKETGSMSFRARVSDLINAGHKIEKKIKTHTNMWGKQIHFKLYKLIPPPQPPKNLIDIMEGSNVKCENHQ